MRRLETRELGLVGQVEDQKNRLQRKGPGPCPSPVSSLSYFLAHRMQVLVPSSEADPLADEKHASVSQGNVDELGIPFIETSSVPAWNAHWVGVGPEPSSTGVLGFAGWRKGSLPCPEPFWRLETVHSPRARSGPRVPRSCPRTLHLSNRAPNSTGAWRVDHMKEGERPLIF